VGKRDDGFHNIETIFYPLPLYDVLELIDANETTLTLNGLEIPGKIEDNIVLKAYNLIKKDFAELSPVHFYLLKNIPAGAGLGAGSANGALALIGLNKKFKLNLSTNQLINYALQLGSDCPFFIMNEPCFAAGRGEIMQPVPIDLSGYKIVIVNPGIHIPTPWAFKQIQPEKPKKSLHETVMKPVEEWKDVIRNDFETPVFKAYPDIEEIKKHLIDAGAVFSLMSGSGSSVYGLFKKDVKLDLNLIDNYFVKVLNATSEN